MEFEEWAATSGVIIALSDKYQSKKAWDAALDEVISAAKEIQGPGGGLHVQDLIQVIKELKE